MCKIYLSIESDNNSTNIVAVIILIESTHTTHAIVYAKNTEMQLKTHDRWLKFL